MPRQPRAKPEPDRPWIRDIPNWVTAIAAVAGVVVTAALGVAALDRPDASPTAATGTQSGPVATASASAAPALTIHPPQDPRVDPASPSPGTGEAQPAGGGGAAPSVEPAIVAIGGFGWEDDVLLVDGTVARFRGPLWLAIQPTTADGDEGWEATRMAFSLGDEWTTPRPFEATFKNATRADRYRIKVFMEHEGFGAGGGPGPDFEHELEEEGGAARPSNILDIVMDVPAE